LSFVEDVHGPTDSRSLRELMKPETLVSLDVRVSPSPNDELNQQNDSINFDEWKFIDSLS